MGNSSKVALEQFMFFTNISELEMVNGASCRLVEMSEETDRQPVGFYLCGPGTGTSSNVKLGGAVMYQTNGYVVNYNTGRNGEYNPNVDMVRYYRDSSTAWTAQILSSNSISINKDDPIVQN